MVQSTLSPDGAWLVSGSETGSPYVWDAALELPVNTKKYECNFMDVISDVDWNTRYNMFVVCGFGQEFPILCYVFARQPEEVDEMLYRYSGKLTSQTAVKPPDLDDP
jgi:hypothetical protein